jgi:hypothetical protein
MKKLLAILAIVALFAGCAYAKNLLCNPTVGEITDAIQASEFIRGDSILSISLAGALVVFENIRASKCVAKADLQAAINDYDAKVASLSTVSKYGAMPHVFKTQAPKLYALRRVAAR